MSLVLQGGAYAHLISSIKPVLSFVLQKGAYAHLISSIKHVLFFLLQGGAYARSGDDLGSGHYGGMSGQGRTLLPSSMTGLCSPPVLPFRGAQEKERRVQRRCPGRLTAAAILHSSAFGLHRAQQQPSYNPLLFLCHRGSAL